MLTRIRLHAVGHHGKGLTTYIVERFQRVMTPRELQWQPRARGDRGHTVLFRRAHPRRHVTELFVHRAWGRRRRYGGADAVAVVQLPRDPKPADQRDNPRYKSQRAHEMTVAPLGSARDTLGAGGATPLTSFGARSVRSWPSGRPCEVSPEAGP